MTGSVAQGIRHCRFRNPVFQDDAARQLKHIKQYIMLLHPNGSSQVSATYNTSMKNLGAAT
jgi:hypothetical protein